MDSSMVSGTGLGLLLDSGMDSYSGLDSGMDLASDMDSTLATNGSNA